MPADEKVRGRRVTVEQYVDAGFIPPDNWRALGLTKVEAARLRRTAYMGMVASQYPRRLGPDISSNMLAGDKFLSRRIAFTYFTLWQRMATGRQALLQSDDLDIDEEDLFPPSDWAGLHRRAISDDEARRAGMTVVWLDWWDELRPRLIARRSAIATFASREQKYGWGYKIVHSITYELKWIEQKFDAAVKRYGEETFRSS